MSGNETDTQRRIREQNEQSLWSLLNPMRFFSGFGGFLMLGIVAAGLYFLGGTERGREMLMGLIEKLPPSWQENLMGLAGRVGMLPDGIDGAGARDMMDIARRHGRSGLSPDDYLDPAIMYDAIRDQPEAVLGVARNLPRGGEANPAGKAAARTLLNDPAKRRMLLSDTHRANTFALLDALSPIRFQNGRLQEFIEATGMRGGDLTPEFLGFVNGMLADGPLDAAALVRFLGRTDQARLTRLFEGADLSALPQPLAAGIETAMALPETSRPIAARIEERLQAHGTSSGEVLGELTGVRSMVRFMLNGELRRNVLAPNIHDIGRMADIQVTEITERLRKPLPPADHQALQAQRKLMRFIGRVQDGNGQWQPVNLNAVNTLFTSIASAPQNGGNHSARTEAVLVGMLGLIAGDNEASASLNAEQVAQFFRVPGNADAFRTFLDSVNTSRADPKLGNIVTALRRHWGNANGGLVDVLDSKESVEWLMNLMREGGNQSIARFLPNSAQVWLGSNLPGWASGLPEDVSQNVTQLDALRAALSNAGVNMSNEAAPANPQMAPAQGGHVNRR